jgi:DNA-binding transcriptional ArsR family regulator
MTNASWIYADLICLTVAILFVFGFVPFMDDLRGRFAWTKASGKWTKAQLTLSSTGFRAWGRCKATISASARAFAGRLSEMDAFPAHFLGGEGKSALTYELELRRPGESRVPRAAIRPIQFKPTQQRAVAALTADPASQLTRGEYEKLAGVSRSQAAYDLAELVEAGILERVGKGRATRYRLAREGGAQRHWTNDRIRDELEAFCADRQTWPSAAEFKAAGRGDLYVAASRYGGIAHWTEVLGFSRSTRNETAVPRPSPLRTKLKWAGAGALAALGLAAAGGAVLVSLDRRGTAPETRAAQLPVTAPSQGVTDESLHSAPVTARKTRTRPAPRVRQTPRARRHRSHASPAKTSSTPAQTRTTSGVAGRTFSSYTPATPRGPAPLPAPSGGSAPPPLKAP